MKMNISPITIISVVVVASAFTLQAGPQVYDLKADWSDTQNPNGAWAYLNPFYQPLSNDPFAWVDPQDGETLSQTTAAEELPGVLETGDIYGRAGFGGSLGPVVRWTAPADGVIDVSGSIWDTSSAPLEILWFLTLNFGNELSGDFSSGSSRNEPMEFSEGWAGPEAMLNIPVHAGDQVHLAIVDSGTIILGGELDGGPVELGDPFGINFTVTFTPDAVDPVTAIENLALTVVEMNLQNGIANSLDSKLDAALAAQNDVIANNDGAAYNTLEAFINAVEAQRGTQLTEMQADQLIAAAQEIQDILASP